VQTKLLAYEHTWFASCAEGVLFLSMTELTASGRMLLLQLSGRKFASQRHSNAQVLACINMS